MKRKCTSVILICVIGKVVLEKICRSLPVINKIYLSISSKVSSFIHSLHPKPNHIHVQALNVLFYVALGERIWL